MSFREFLHLPIVASAHGHEVDMVIYLIHILMAFLFVGWGAFFIIALIRFRKKKNPQADYTGVKSHISTTLEVAVVIFEVILLVGFSIPFWAKNVNAFPNRTDTVEVRIVAKQFLWNIHYPGADNIFGNTEAHFVDDQTNPLGIDPDDPNGKDDFTDSNNLDLPIGRPAIIYLSSNDVIHSFSLPEMRVKQDVIPGMIIPTWFTPTKTGKYEIACAQLCGLGHYRMRGVLTIHSQEDYDAWLEDEAPSISSEDEVDDFWN